MATKFEPVTVEMIDQGKFLADGEIAFAKVQKKVIEHAKKHGGASGEITLKVKIQAGEGGAFKLITDVTEKMPKKPARVTTAFVSELDGAGECLFSQAGGTVTGDPKQTRLFNDGKPEAAQEPADVTT